MPPVIANDIWRSGFIRLWQPEVMAVTLACAAGYLYLVGPLSRGRPALERATPLQKLLFLSMLVVMYLTFGSPVDWTSDHVYFSAHMIEHIVDTMVMAPIFLFGLPAWLVRECLRPAPLRRLWRAATRPVVALLAFGAVFSGWHMQPLYHWTLTNDTVHFAEHASMFVAALIFWWPIVSPLPDMPRLSDLRQIAYLVAGMLLGWPLFYALTLIPTQPLYPFYVHAYRALGLTSPRTFALHDQQFGGILMMGSTMVVMGSALAAAFFRWTQAEERREAEEALGEGSGEAGPGIRRG